MTDTIYLISACDINAWIWPYWYAYFKRSWDFNCGIDVVMICENIAPELPGIKYYRVGSESWPLRMKTFIEQHPSVNYIIYGVEDQLLMEPVNVEGIKKLVEQMRRNNTKYISLHQDKYMSAVVQRNDRRPFRNLIRIPYSHYQVFTLQCALFESKFFHFLMRPQDDIWHIEINGHERIRRARVQTYMYVDRSLIRFREVLRKGKLKPHRMKYLWAVDADEMFPAGDRELDRHETKWYYEAWKDKIKSETVLREWVK